MNAEPSSFWDLLVRLPAGDRRAGARGVLGVLGALLIIVIAVIVSKTVYRIHKSRLENALKYELVERRVFAGRDRRNRGSVRFAQARRDLTSQGRKTPKEIEHAYAK